MHIVFNALFLLAAIKWGDWERWKHYYPTILFLICIDLVKNFLLYNYWMWTYEELFFGENILQQQWMRKIVASALVGALIYTGHKYELMIFKEGWFWQTSFFMILWIYTAVWGLDRLYKGRRFEG